MYRKYSTEYQNMYGLILTLELFMMVYLFISCFVLFCFCSDYFNCGIIFFFSCGDFSDFSIYLGARILQPN